MNIKADEIQDWNKFAEDAKSGYAEYIMELPSGIVEIEIAKKARTEFSAKLMEERRRTGKFTVSSEFRKSITGKLPDPTDPVEIDMWRSLEIKKYCDAIDKGVKPIISGIK